MKFLISLFVAIPLLINQAWAQQINGRTIDLLNPAATLSGPELWPIVQGSNPAVKTTTSGIRDFIKNSIPLADTHIGILAPEFNGVTGSGTQGSPFTSGDGTGGIQNAINSLAGLRNGMVSLGAASYSMTASATITQPSVTLKCNSRGFNIDPDGLTQGVNGCGVTTPAALPGFVIGAASTRVGGFIADDMYLFGAGTITDGSIGYKFAGAGGGTDTAQFHRGLISHVQYGIYGGATMDAPMITNTMCLGVGYCIYLPSGGGGAIWGQFLGIGAADDANAGVFDASTAGGTQTLGGVFVRNGYTLTTHGGNYYTTGAGAGLIGAVLDQPGLNFLTSSQVAADNAIIDGQFNRVIGNWLNRTPNGSNVHLTASAQFNMVALNMFGVSSGSSVLLDSGASENAIYSPVPITVTDNSAHNNYLDYIVQAGGALVNSRIIQSAATINTIFKVNSIGQFGAYIGFDATVLSGGHNYTMGSTAGSAADGQGNFVITDQTMSGTDRLIISGAGVVTIPGYAQVKTGFIIGAAALTLSAGEVGLTKIAATGAAPGATGMKFEGVCGTTGGTMKIIAYAGTSTTPVTITDNIGSGVSGC